jgi:hypothetical protein
MKAELALSGIVPSMMSDANQKGDLGGFSIHG